ncbi:quinic acid utilization activator [Fusarium pseudocircinatum]|uniref:Quinic acid utilization activator n=1 Tax=Fusarium pseudocircinatum TaxID=56676 RepID=A0A8H5UUJ0_9HYPO|nr:quinic acid utilization activator [Fusarium pseudocircinatum]
MKGNPESSVRRACESCRKPGSRDRVSSVENRDEIYDLIHHPQAASSSNGSALTPDSLPRHTNRSGSFVESASRRLNRVSINDEVSVSWLPSATEARPSPDSLDHAVEEYRRRLYFQPLPLFDPEGLRGRIERFPMFLQWIFLALALSNLPYDSSSAKEADLIHSHARSARDMVLELAMRGTAQLEISQALCLLALGDILGTHPAFFDHHSTNTATEGRPALALMTIGAASRLELVRGAGYSESPHSPQGDASLRCYWSVFILEKGFAPRFTLLSQTHTKPEYPRSAREPSPPAYLGDEEYAPDLESIRDDLRTDPGITSHAVRAVSFCGDVISYLHALHIGKADNPADTNSNFYQLTNTLYDLESRLGDLVAATATIPWLFQYARDAKVSETSKENYRKCIEFLESMPDPSPRSIHKRELLYQLQTMSSQAQDNNMISFQPSKIWQLIDSDIMDAVAPQPTTDGTQGGQSDASKTTVSVQTTFVHPVGERRADQRQTSLGDSMTADIYEGLEQYSLDSIFSQPMFIDHAWLHV